MIVPPTPSRRAVLAAACAVPLLGVAACTAAPRPPEPTPVDPLADVLDRHAALREQYDVAITALPQTAPRLQPLRDNINEHIAALAAAQGVAPPSSSAPASTSGASGSSAAASPTAAPPADEPTALAALAAAETDLGSVVSALVSSEPTERAPLLGSITAAHACHAAALA
ncbi:hypothetical protein EK0264_17395 [Epidermidibacterium keratini]|uniref:DUF4439 domain-containing protein n=1 Tax=Epidermidibacterium keratini TaxID=1891644 RepID=A0A7L4YRY7_9ACTN|nr:hypothetical protein [Epidermidibacterium keratini]QHC01880.1 hypothetical protein EK0264_17395 [Epidermidibacterium keratini]